MLANKEKLFWGIELGSSILRKNVVVTCHVCLDRQALVQYRVKGLTFLAFGDVP